MSINGVDYSKQLAKDREYFQDANRKTKEAAEKRIEDTNRRADHVISKQRKNFIEDKAELEKHYQENVNNLKEKTQASLEGRNSELHKRMEKERESFTQDSIKKSKDFDQRLNDIKSSYSKAFSTEKDRNDNLDEIMTKKYNANVRSIRDNADSKVQSFQDRLSATTSELKDQYSRERQDLVRAQEDRLTEVSKDSARKRADLEGRVMTDSRKTKEAKQAEMDQKTQYLENRLSRIQDKLSNKNEALATDYKQRHENLVDAQQKSALETSKAHNEEVSELRRKFNGELRQRDLEKHRKESGSGEFADVSKRQQGLKDQIINDNKIKNLKNDLVSVQRTYQKRAEDEQKSFNNTLNTEAADATVRMEQKLKEANANKILSVSREREKSEEQVQSRDHQNRLDKSAYEAQLMNERNAANVRMKKLKENFNTSLKALEVKQHASIDDVTKTANQDKKAFLQKNQENRSNEIFELKREFAKTMDSTVQNYEQRLANYQRDNEYLKMSMDQKINSILDQTQKQLDAQAKLFEDRRTADVKGQQLLMDQRESLLKKNFAQMNLNYQKKIDKMQMDNNSKLKLITNEYESKLKELKALTNKELASKDANQLIELERIKQSYEDEKQRLVNSYEGQIDNIKKGHKDQMSQMADYKRLS